MAKNITERYNARPIGTSIAGTPHSFRFSTQLEADPVPDGEGGMLKVEPKEVESTGLFFIGGTLRTLDEVKKKNDPKEEILRSNMECNNMSVIIENCNSWKFTGGFSEQDCIVDENGNIVKRGDDPELVKYRKKKLKS